MAEIKLSDGTLIKVPEKAQDLRGKLVGRDRFVLLKDRDGKEYDVNTDQIVFLRDS